MSAKKIIGIIVSVVFIAAFVFVLVWGIINWNKVKDGLSGSGLYTQDDIQISYEDGYNTALADKEEYEKLITSYRDTITTQTDLISQYTSEANALNNSIKDYQEQVENLTEQRGVLETQVGTLTTVKTNNEKTIDELNGQIETLSGQVLALQGNKDENERRIAQLNEQIANLQSLNKQLQENNELNVNTIAGLNAQIANLNNQISDLTLQAQDNSSVVNALNTKIAELQKSVSYYEQYIAALENGEQVVATFEFDGSVYNIQIVNKNSLLTVTPPQSTAYVIFNGWTVNGEPIDLETFRITENTKIVADVTHKYEVNFMVDGENYHNEIVVKDSHITPPAEPQKAGYVFGGWTINGNAVVDFETYTVTQNVTFTAKFVKLYSVVFKYEETTLSTQTVKSGEFATAPETTTTAYKVFNGWKVNGIAVNVEEYRITADTVFVADITYKFDVKFIADGATHDTQIVEKNGKPAVPENPTKQNYTFVGWSLNGTNTVSVADTVITENTTFTAIFKINEYTVTFKNGNTVLSEQQIQHGEYATAPASPTKENHTFAGWSLNGTDTVNVADTAITENTTFTAVFKINEYTVTFKDGNKQLSAQQVEHGKFASVPEPPTKGGYTFAGWSVDGTTVIAVESYTITKDTTFIAVFKQAGKPYSLGFDTLGYGSMSSFDYDCVGEALTGETVTFSLTLLDLSDKYDTYKPLKISRVVLQDENGNEIFDLEEINGAGVMNKVGQKYEFSFELPEKYAGQYITIMVYLLPLDF